MNLKNYRVDLDPGSELVKILSPLGTSNPYYVHHGWVEASGKNITLPSENTLWSSDKFLTPNNPVTLTWENGKGLSFQRVISIDDNFMFNIEQSVTNQGSSTAALAPYGQVARHGEPPNLKGFFILHEGMVRMSDGELNETDYGIWLMIKFITLIVIMVG